MTSHAAILYWFPGRMEPPPEYAGRFRDADGAERGCYARSSEGPEAGARGCLASPMHGVMVAYLPAVQRWDRLAPGIWIGARKDAAPEAFARARQYDGYRRVLGDGREWLVPVANPLAATCRLPSHDVLTDGTWQRRIDDAYTALSDRAAELSARVRAAVLDGRSEGIDMPDDDLRAIMADCLALNYDLTLAEMSALRLFSPAVYWPVVSALIDWEATRLAMAEAMEGQPGAGGAPFGGSDPAPTSATASAEPPAGGTP